MLSLLAVARGDDGLGALPEGCDGVGRVILEECDCRAVVEDEGDRPVVVALVRLAWRARAVGVVVDPIQPNNFRPVGVVPSFLLTVAEAELRALKSDTLSDSLLKGGVAALEGAGVLALAKVGPARDERLVPVLTVPEDFDDAFIPCAWHEAPEGEVDGGLAGFAVDVCVDSVDLSDIVVCLVERFPDEQLVLVVLEDAFSKFAVGGDLVGHWSVGKCVRAAGADEHGRVTTQRQGPRDEITPTGKNAKEEQHAGWNNNGAPMRTVLKTGRHTSLRAEIYRPVAVYLRLLALLVATYSGTAQCHNYSDNGTTKERGGDHGHAKINVLVLTWGVGRTGRGACGWRGRLVLMLATAKEQTKGASEDERNAKAGEKPEQVWGFIAMKPRLYIQVKAQSVQTEVHNRLCLVSVAEAMSKYAEAGL
jgi:hypothetical protein